MAFGAKAAARQMKKPFVPWSPNRERAGRNLPLTDDAIFASGAFPNVMIGKEALEARDRAQSNPDTRRENYQVHSTIMRLEVAEGGQMAYDYSTFHLSFDLKKEHRELDGSSLRVWKKVNGEWKVAAMFARPNGDPASKAR
jgi:ketosteroid isomerase-like protein